MTASFSRDGDRLKPGQVVANRYRVQGVIGVGGMGEVYAAHDEDLDRPVALKVLPPAQAENPQMIERFAREAKAAARVVHPGIVEVYDRGKDGELSFVVMEKLEGEDLAACLASRWPLAPGFVARVGAEIAHAAHHGHERGVVHRDLKPRNVFLAQRGQHRDVVKVLDFGIAKLTAKGLSMTDTAQIFGTMGYMAPEVLKGAKNASPASDIYSIGCILYEMLTNRPPFRASNYAELLLIVNAANPTPIESLREDVPSSLISVVSRAMAREARQRYPTALELAEALYCVASELGEPVPNARFSEGVTTTASGSCRAPADQQEPSAGQATVTVRPADRKASRFPHSTGKKRPTSRG